LHFRHLFKTIILLGIAFDVENLHQPEQKKLLCVLTGESFWFARWGWGLLMPFIAQNALQGLG
jgi:hypothetical protein